MKIFYTLVLISIGYLSAAQTQEVQESQKKITESVDRIIQLKKLDIFTSQLITNSFCWIYLITNQHAQSDLKNQIYLELPEIKRQIASATLGHEYASKVSSITSSIEDLASLAQINMDRLNKFEDYFDSTESYSENYREAERRFNQEMVPMHRLVSASIEKEIDDQEGILLLLLNTIEKTGSKSKINISEINDRYKIVTNRFEALKLNEKLMNGAIRWVYSPADSVSKLELQRDISFRSKALLDSMKFSFDKGELEEQVRGEILMARFDTLIARVSSITNLLKNADDYDDGLTFLLSEDEIETGIFPRYWEIQSIIQVSVVSEIEKLQMCIQELPGKKNADIKRMLQYNYSTLQYLVSEANKSNPEFKIDDLIDTLIPIYAKRFTHEEIKEIIKFQNSKVGKKMRKHSASILLETMHATANYYKTLSSKKD